ncbi:UNKNOWN [Stylonychia lemnae]|uniref:Uncharacterized protein n=1 Tax=Stylonychia lemnae TaxID=5949 RepID=A0A078BC64_STYLE|nr:UNKNOWN [Stylonychia lemnae]|eukprot:CDW91188.1 UNKNOWN [Stylonychia lemnae]
MNLDFSETIKLLEFQIFKNQNANFSNAQFPIHNNELESNNQENSENIANSARHKLQSNRLSGKKCQKKQIRISKIRNESLKNQQQELSLLIKDLKRIQELDNKKSIFFQPQEYLKPNFNFYELNCFPYRLKKMKNGFNSELQNDDQDNSRNQQQIQRNFPGNRILKISNNTGDLLVPIQQHSRLAMISSQASLKQIKTVQLQSDTKQTTILNNAHDNFKILGLENSRGFVYNQDFSHIYGVLQLSSQIVSHIQIDPYLILGLNDSSLNILCKVNYESKMIVHLAKNAFRFIEFIQYFEGLNHSYLMIFEGEGYIQILDMHTLEIVYTFQHSNKFSIHSAEMLHDSQHILLAQAQLDNTSKFLGGISTVILTCEEVSQSFTLTECENPCSLLDQIKGPVLNIVQITQNIIITTEINNNFIVYDINHNTKSRIFNPSQSINYCFLQRIQGFSNERPYLIYQDSRSIGLIDCNLLQAVKLVNISYQRCGNYYSMFHYETTNELSQNGAVSNIINVLALQYNRQQNERGISCFQFSLQ